MSMRRERPVLKTICYLLFLVLVYVIETANMPLALFGFRIDLLPCIPAAIALMEGPFFGGMFGLLTRILYDVGFVGVDGLFPIYYMLFGIAAGAVSMRFLRRMFPSMLLLSTCGMLLIGMLRFGFSVMLFSGAPFPLAFQSMCGEILVSVVLSPVIYLPVRTIARRFDRML